MNTIAWSLHYEAWTSYVSSHFGINITHCSRCETLTDFFLYFRLFLREFSSQYQYGLTVTALIIYFLFYFRLTMEGRFDWC